MYKTGLADWIATVAKIGTIPGPHGTYGSLAAVITWFLIIDYLNIVNYLIIIIILFFIGVITGGVVEKTSGNTDPGRIVIDEWVGQWIALLTIPKSVIFGLGAFLLFRLFDIWKPWPIKKIEKLHGGLGIMADDVLAGIYSLAVIKLILFFK